MLKELKNHLLKISYLACDTSGNLFVNHFNGISQYNEVSKKWLHYNKIINSASTQLTSSAIVINKNEICFITSQGIVVLKQRKINVTTSDYFKPVGLLINWVLIQVTLMWRR